MYKFPEKLRKAYEALKVPVLFMGIGADGETVPILISDGFLELHSITRDMVEEYFGGNISGSLFEKVHPDETEKLRIISDDFVINHQDYDVTFRARRDDGYHLIHATGYWQVMPDGSEVALIVYNDIQKHEEIMSKLSEKYSLFQKDDFYTDTLTNLPNTNYLYKYGNDRQNDIFANKGTPVVMYLDVDSMQSYNNNYGFKRGDDLLRLVTRVLLKEFPRALVTRASDDHFVVLDTYPGKKTLAETIERVNELIKSDAYGNTTGIHIGIYVNRRNIILTEALNHAKRANKLIGEDLNKTYRFYSKADDEIFKKQRYIIENFYKALNNGWIRVFYQCFMRIESGNGVGFEILARWKDPKYGMISPGDFIPTLEKYHLMHELDLYMFEQVCREIKLRYEANLPILPVSINFSRQDFDYIDVVGEINRIYDEYNIDQYGIDKSFFIIEITEQDIATATESFYKQLESIRENGYKLWLDDFGSGYSALNVFSNFHVDLIKIDMELLQKLNANNGVNREIIKAVIAVAKRMKIQVLCEGLETEEQLDFLREAGCDLAQGFLYHKPEGLDTIFERLDIGLPIPKWETTEERKRLEKVYSGGSYDEMY